jgi:hypothetical protein
VESQSGQGQNFVASVGMFSAMPVWKRQNLLLRQQLESSYRASSLNQITILQETPAPIAGKSIALESNSAPAAEKNFLLSLFPHHCPHPHPFPIKRR